LSEAVLISLASALAVCYSLTITIMLPVILIDRNVGQAMA